VDSGWIWLVLFLIFLIIAIQPAMAMNALRRRRRAKIAELEKKHKARVVTLIHRQERAGLLGFSQSRYIDIDDAQSVIRAIRETRPNRPIDLVLHTPGGLVLAAMQIARAVRAHPAKVRVFVPVYAMSGGTLIALAADEIVMSEFAVLGPIDPQIGGMPAASIVNATRVKPVERLNDLTLIFADVGQKAIQQLRKGATEILSEKMPVEQAASVADLLTRGEWTHDYAITPEEARGLGLRVSTEFPEDIFELLSLYPQPARQTQSVEHLRWADRLDGPPEGASRRDGDYGPIG